MAAPVPATEDGAASEHATGGAFGKKGIGWAIFEFARNPYYNAVVISAFAPYFAAQVIGDPVRGQSLVSLTITIAGIICAIAMPILGSMIDIGGRRKPLAYMSLGALVVTSALLWFVQPGLPGAIILGMALMVIGYVSYTVAELIHNSMLPMSGKPDSLPYISGLGLALGNFAGTTVILLLLFLFVLPGDPENLLPDAEPFLGLDRETWEHQRVTGPFVALWLLLFIGPFFLFMPDIKPTAERNWKAAAKKVFGGNASTADTDAPKAGLLTLASQGIAYIKQMFDEYPNVMRYLVGRMIYADGIGALLTVGTVFVSGLLGWSGVEILAVAVLGTLAAVCGAMTAGGLDRALGPKRSLQLELGALIVILTIQLSISPNAILFGLIESPDPFWSGIFGGNFTSLSDITYLGFMIPGSFLLGAAISSSRYMLVHIAPPEEIGKFFGFYAMAGSVTLWMGPGLVWVMTELSGNQRIGMSGLGALFIVGIAIISTVRADKTPEHLKPSPRY